MTENTLLPCPFCGSDAIIIHEDRVWIECADCPSKAGVGPFNTRAEALTAWNTRADSHHRLIEALRGLAGNAGALRAFEWEIREACGNTNWQCLMDAIAKADAALKEAGHG